MPSVSRPPARRLPHGALGDLVLFALRAEAAHSRRIGLPDVAAFYERAAELLAKQGTDAAARAAPQAVLPADAA